MRAGARGPTDPTARQVFVVDTSVIVSGLIGADPNSPPTRILDAMLDGDLLYLMSSALLAEDSTVLRRPRITRLHGRADDELDRFLTELVESVEFSMHGSRATPCGRPTPPATEVGT